MTIRTLMIAIVTLALASCASRGNEVLRMQSTATVDLIIVDGKTTRQEVQAIYGAPTQMSFLNEKNELWTYKWSRATAQGQNFIPIIGPLVRGYDTRSKELVIVFNEHSIVARHSMSDVNDTVRTGLLDKGDAPSPGSVSPSPPPPPAQTPNPASSSVVPAGTASQTPAVTVGGSSAPSPVAGQSQSRSRL